MGCEFLLVLWVLLLAWAPVGCEPEEMEFASQWGGDLSPVATDGRLSYVRPTTGDLLVLSNPSKGRVNLGHVKLCSKPMPPQETPDGRVAILCPDQGQLVVVQPSTLKVARWTLGSPFNRVTFSDNGQMAVAFHGSNSNQTTQGLTNPHQIAIIHSGDLVNGEQEGVTMHLPSQGSVPMAIDIGPLVDGRRMGVVRSMSYILLLDLSDQDVQPVMVPLTANPTGSQVKVSRTVFGEDGRHIFLVASGADDVFSLALPPPGEGIRPVINQFPGGRNPSELVVFDGADGNMRVMVLSPGSSTLSVIDVASSRDTQINLPEGVNRVVTHCDPDHPEQPRAILFRHRGRSLYLVDLQDLESSRIRAIRTKALPAPLQEVKIMGDAGLAALIHDGTPSVSVLDMRRETVSPFGGTFKALDSVFDGDEGRLYVVITGTTPILSMIDLATLHPVNMPLERSGHVHLLPSQGRLAIAHSGLLGAVSFFDLNSPSAETGTYIEGFLLTGVLDR